MKNSMNSKTNQKGFTLIELVVVIVILGILAVTAAPKFINLQDDAQTATLEGVRAAMNSASALVHSKSLIAGNDDDALGDGPTVVINSTGATVPINFGYPSNVVADWTPLLEIDGNDFTTIQEVDSASTTLIIIYPQNNTAPDLAAWAANGAPTADANCFAYYYTPAAANGEPVTGSVSCQVL
jgi:MSHA pilin protein MshA